MTDSQKDRFINWFEVALRVGYPILLGIAGWQFSQTWDHQSRLVSIESSRYTVLDGSRDRAEFAASIATVREEAARASQAAASLNARLDRIEKKLDSLLERDGQ